VLVIVDALYCPNGLRDGIVFDSFPSLGVHVLFRETVNILFSRTASFFEFI
jgi:hypothetical protein